MTRRVSKLNFTNSRDESISETWTQCHKHFTLVNYYSRVVLTRILPILGTTLES